MTASGRHNQRGGTGDGLASVGHGRPGESTRIVGGERDEDGKKIGDVWQNRKPEDLNLNLDIYDRENKTQGDGAKAPRDQPGMCSEPVQCMGFDLIALQEAKMRIRALESKLQEKARELVAARRKVTRARAAGDAAESPKRQRALMEMTESKGKAEKEARAQRERADKMEVELVRAMRLQEEAKKMLRGFEEVVDARDWKIKAMQEELESMEDSSGQAEAKEAALLAQMKRNKDLELCLAEREREIDRMRKIARRVEDTASKEKEMEKAIEAQKQKRVAEQAKLERDEAQAKCSYQEQVLKKLEEQVMNELRKVQNAAERREERLEAEIVRVAQDKYDTVMEAKRLVGEHAEKRRIAERATEQMQAVVERAVANADGMAITTKKLIAELSRMQKEKVDSKARVVERETLPSNRKTKKKKRSANADHSYTPRPPRATPSSTKAENRKKKTVRSVKTTGQPDLRTKRAETRERHLGHQDKTTRDNLLRSRITRRLRITNAATRIGHELLRITTEKQGKRALWIRIQKSIEHKMQRRDFKRILQEKVVSTLKAQKIKPRGNYIKIQKKTCSESIHKKRVRRTRRGTTGRSNHRNHEALCQWLIPPWRTRQTQISRQRRLAAPHETLKRKGTKKAQNMAMMEKHESSGPPWKPTKTKEPRYALAMHRRVETWTVHGGGPASRGNQLIEKVPWIVPPWGTN